MADSTQETAVKISGDAAGATAAMKQAAEAVKSGVDSMKASMDGLHAVFGKVQTALLAVTSAVAGGAALKEFVQSAIDTTKESVALGKALGITATEASYLRSAADNVGVSMDMLMNAGSKITRTLTQNEGAFANLGVATRDANGHLRNTRQIMDETNARLREFREGTDRNVEGMKIYGRSWAEIAPLVNKFKGETEESRREAEALNLVVGQEAVSALANYKTAQAGLGEVIDGVKKTIGDALIPRLTELANWFRSVGPQAVEVTRTAMAAYLAIQNEVKNTVVALYQACKSAFESIASAINTAIGRQSEAFSGMEMFQNVLKVIQIAFISLRIGVEESVNAIRYVLLSLASVARLAGAVIGAALHTDPAGVRAAWAEYKAETAKQLEETVSAAVAIAAKGREDIDKAALGDLAARGPVTAVKNKDGGERSEGGTAGAQQGQGRMPQWEAALADRKLNLAEMANAEGGFRELSKAEEAAYWKEILARADLSEKERLDVRRRYAGAAFEVRKQAFDAELETLKTERDEMEKNYLERTRIAGEAYRKIVAAYGEESTQAKKAYAEVLAEHRKFVDQQRQLDTMAADLRRQQRTAAIDIERLALQEQQALGTVTREQALAAERGFEDRLYQIRLEGLRERQALLAADPNHDPVAAAQVNDQIEQAELQHQQRMAQITQQMRLESLSPITSTLQTVQGAWAGLIDQMAKGTLTIGGFIRGVFKTAADAVIQTLSKMAAEWAVKQIAMSLFGKASALGGITREAGKAGAGGVASMAAAPFPLNLGAPEFGAAMMGAALSFAPLASARGGFDIPAGLNPLTQLHEKEMVLPQGPADVIRAMAAGRGGAAREPNVITQNNTFMVQGTVDRRSQEQVFQQAYAAMVEANGRNG